MSVCSVHSLVLYRGGRLIVSDIAFEVSRGEILGVTGPNGSGKSTLLDALSGFVLPDHGEISLRGESLAGEGPCVYSKRGVRRVFQERRVFSRLSVAESLRVARLLGEEDTSCAPAHSSDVADWFLASGLGEIHGAELSHGQSRLLGLAIALAGSPTLLLIDEPLSGLDSSARSVALESIVTFVRAGGAAIWVEHDNDVLSAHCDDVLALPLLT